MLLRAPQTTKAMCLWCEELASGKDYRPETAIRSPVDTLPKPAPTDTHTSLPLRHCSSQGHSDLLSENCLFGGALLLEPLVPNCQWLTLLHTATFLRQMKLQMRR